MRAAQTSIEHGVTIAYRDSDPSGVATGVPVILVHGMGGSGRTWDAFARALVKRGRRVITVDLRGHGKSTKPGSYQLSEFGGDVVGIIDHLDLESADLVGHSLGGQAVLRAAQAAQGRVRRLVLEEAPPLPQTLADLDEVQSQRRSLRAIAQAIPSLLRNPSAFLTYDRTVTTLVIRQFDNPDAQWWDQLAQLEIPTLVISGGPQSYLKVEHLARMSDALANSRFVTIDAGHSVHRDRPRQFEAAVLPFLMQD